MTTNNNSKYKQENELLKISPLIRSLGYTPNFNMCGDKPDICLPSFENKEIGIEVTEYAERYHVKVESNEKVRGDLLFKARQDLKKILDSYIDYFDNRNNRGNYNLNKNFNNDLFQNNNKNNLNRNNVNQRRIINININNNINNSYNNRQNQSQKYQNNNIFNDYQRSDKGMNIRKKYNDNNVFEIDPLNNNNNKNENMPFNNRNKNLMNKRISNENDFNNIFGPS